MSAIQNYRDSVALHFHTEIEKVILATQYDNISETF